MHEYGRDAADLDPMLSAGIKVRISCIHFIGVEVGSVFKKCVACVIMGMLLLPFNGLASTSEAAVTSTDLWEQYVQNPYKHPNIPNNSYAGYRRGELPIPLVPVVVSVTDFGAVADDGKDDTEAFLVALEEAGNLGGGAILVPSGTYQLSEVLLMKHSGVVLRGEDRASTILEFTRPLEDMIGVDTVDGKSEWSWKGGMVWISPQDTFFNGNYNGTETWKTIRELGQVSAPAEAGDFTVQVDDTAGLTPGDTVLMVWDNPEDASLLKHITGHPLMDSYDWSAAGAGEIMPPGWPKLHWPVEIASISGSEVRLKQPLRMDIQPEWKVRFADILTSVQEIGVESLTLRLHAPETHRHLQNIGWNGVFVNRALHSWVRDLTIESAENGIILSAAKNVTVTDIDLIGEEMMHHPFALRSSSHDNLFENFAIRGQVRVVHGINTERFSSGNVWSRGMMEKGTFDSHRALPYDFIRTEITLANEKSSAPGGSATAGPYVGKRAVHWNVRIDDSDRVHPGKYVYQPDALTQGALVGIQGAPMDDTCSNAMVCGDKGVIVAYEGSIPQPANLYEAQLELRRSQESWVHITSPSKLNESVSAEGVVLGAVVNGKDGVTIDRVEYWQGADLLGSATASPYEYNWNPPDEGGVYKITAKLIDSAGEATVSLPLQLHVEGIESATADHAPVNVEETKDDVRPTAVTEDGNAFPVAVTILILLVLIGASFGLIRYVKK